ncbi:MAG: MerR family transcriptional regulator [Devosia sp.]
MVTAAKDDWITAAECAERVGISVRALRHYERCGLIVPRRTDKRWRLYGATEIVRLNEVLALKALGFRLSEIGSLLAGVPADLGRMFDVQRDVLQSARAKAERGLAAIDAAQATIAAGGVISIDGLMDLLKETTMSDKSKDTVAWRRYDQNRPRTEVAIDKALYAQYKGAYQLEDGTFYEVIHKDGHLFTRVIGQPEIEIFPEAVDRFFMTALPVQVTFVRGSEGSVIGLVHHQYGEEMEGTRIDQAVLDEADAELQKRVREKLAFPRSAEIIRRIIDEASRGQTNYEAMSPALAALAREQSEIVQATMKNAGALEELSFKGVSAQGWDVYEAMFDHAKMEWAFMLAADGKISGLYLRPSP